jgi:hypothetical protein
MSKRIRMSKKSGSKVGVVTKTAGDLGNAARQGNVAEVHAILDNNPALLDKPGRSSASTALMHATENGHLPIAELLLNRGCAIDIQEEYGRTALIWAAAYGRTDVARVLLVRGADLTLIGQHKNSRRDTLGHANASGHTAIVELIEKEKVWRRRKNWMMFSSMFKTSLTTSTAPTDSLSAAMERALSMDEITWLIAK